MKDTSLNTMKNLYLKKNFSARKIAVLCDCSTATVIKKLRNSNVSIRSPYKSLDVSDNILIDLYVNKKMSTWKIGDMLKVSRSAIHRKLRKLGQIRSRSQAHIIHSRKSFDGGLREKAYLVGFTLGDLRVRKFYKNSETIFVDSGSTKIEQVDLFKSLFEKYGKVWIGKPTSKGRIQTQVLLDMSFSFLLDCEKEFYSWINGNREYFIAFLAGFTDAEGSIFLRKDKNPTFSIGNYNRSLLEKIRENLMEMGLEINKIKQDRYLRINLEGYKRNGIYCYLNITQRETIIQIFSLLKPYLRHQKRLNDLDIAVKNINDKISKKYGG